MAIRTTTTSRTRTSFVSSAHQSDAAISIEELVRAYYHCRQNKRTTESALDYERNLEANLVDLHHRLVTKAYRPGRSICFIRHHPKPREVWAAQYEDRVVHHALYDRISGRFERDFIHTSCACIPGRGTLYAAQWLEHYVRSVTGNWGRQAYYLKCDLASFFVSINKGILYQLLAERIHEPWWLWLTETILFHDPRADVEVRARPAELALIPSHKSLFNQAAGQGLPIGNLSSQFFANVLLNPLDQLVKHRLRARHYVRYVDDFILLHEDPAWLNDALRQIAAFLPRLGLRLNPAKTVLQSVARGIDFVGHVLKPWHRRIRRVTANNAFAALNEAAPADVFTSAASYFGVHRQATHSHRDRARLANLIRARGHAVDGAFTKAYR